MRHKVPHIEDSSWPRLEEPNDSRRQICPFCSALLLEGVFLPGVFFKIKCSRCKKMVTRRFL